MSSHVNDIISTAWDMIVAVFINVRHSPSLSTACRQIGCNSFRGSVRHYAIPWSSSQAVGAQKWQASLFHLVYRVASFFMQDFGVIAIHRIARSSGSMLFIIKFRHDLKWPARFGLPVVSIWALLNARQPLSRWLIK